MNRKGGLRPSPNPGYPDLRSEIRRLKQQLFEIDTQYLIVSTQNADMKAYIKEKMGFDWDTATKEEKTTWVAETEEALFEGEG